MSVLELHLAFTEEDSRPEAEREALLERCRALLDPGERARAARFHFERDRTLYTLAHGLVRHVLGRKLGVDGSSLRFREGEHGRPELDGPHAGAAAFNLSHTQGVVLLGVAPTGDTLLGVDVEIENHARAGLAIAERFFSPFEFQNLAALAGTDQTAGFYSYWTLKEAYVKARGAGLTLPLDSFSFDLRHLPELSVHFDPSLAESPGDWHFGLFRASTVHHAAYALRWPAAEAVELRAWRVNSLEHFEPFTPKWVGRPRQAG